MKKKLMAIISNHLPKTILKEEQFGTFAQWYGNNDTKQNVSLKKMYTKNQVHVCLNFDGYEL